MRLFFALVPGDDVRAKLAVLASDLAHAAAGRVVPAGNLHLTLVFVGDAGASLSPRLRDVLPGMPRNAFTLMLDRIGGWRAARVGWIAPTVVPEDLAALHARLRDAVAACGISVEARPFRPHVTLVRCPDRMPHEAPTAPIAWNVRRLALLRSESAAGGVRYLEEAAVTLGARR